MMGSVKLSTPDFVIPADRNMIRFNPDPYSPGRLAPRASLDSAFTRIVPPPRQFSDPRTPVTKLLDMQRNNSWRGGQYTDPSPTNSNYREPQPEANIPEDVAEDAEEPIEEATEVVEDAKIVSAVGEVAEASNPVTLMALANSAVGSGVNEAADSNVQAGITSNYQHNMAVGTGIGSSLRANIIQQQAESKAAAEKGFGSVGSFLGPLGVGIGRAIGSTLYSDRPAQQDLDTAYSFGGRIDPQSDNINFTNSSFAIQPWEMSNGEQDNVSVDSSGMSYGF